MATVLQQRTCEGLGHTREGKGSSGKRVVETNIMVGHQRGFSSARAMVQLSHSITCEVHNPGWGPLQISAITILPHPLTSKHQYQGKLRRAVRKLRPDVACARIGHGCSAVPRGRDEQVGSEGLTSALGVGVDVAGPAAEDEWIRGLPDETHPG
ncbi:hypothetical protein HGM15179_005133 [Zosterops borbonicus]|uniref:Uncharacterized protein n=1 Tax=Zosterops borbonicus TaxID=364589 RepID=A0A8K1GMX5_9PASS|nr:hypothetical protein HGM15179_005133 [Zosterops borbonicus]